MKTTIINATRHVLDIQHPKHILVTQIPSMRKYSMRADESATYREYNLVVGKQFIVISNYMLFEAAEIRVYETPTQKLECRVTKMRGSTYQQAEVNIRDSAIRVYRTPSQELEWRVSKTRGSTYQQAEVNIRDSAAFDAVIKDASSRMTSIEKSHARLMMLLKQVKICPAQCQNLVKTCVDGVKEMKSAYTEKSEDYVWQLYSSKKLGQFISSLGKLLCTLGSIQDLLQACGSNWGSMALVVSLPLPPPERAVSSKFDILLKELHWNLETIHYALDLSGGVEFKWSERKFRYVLDGPEVKVAEDMEHEQPGGCASADRKDLLSQLENGLILVPGNPWLWHLGLKFATDHRREKLAVELQKRLKETAVLSNDSQSPIPDCYWINDTDLKLHRRLAENSFKSVWKGQWCGQAVAIGVTKYADREDVAKEAGIMLKLQHPNIVGFLGCAFTADAPPKICSENEKCSAGYLVMELMQEDLRHVIDRRARSHFGNPFALDVTVDILFQIAGGMVHMHNLGIMHRDLKSANCLVNLSSNSQVLKLIDFEFTKELDPDAPISKHTVKRGTVQWMAPEVWGIQTSDANSSERPSDVPYSKSADVWSFGMTCYEVITGKHPFEEYRSTRDFEKALQEGKRPSIPASVSCPEGLKSLLSRCWAQEPSDRPNFKDIEKDLWTIKYQLEIQ